MAFKMKEDLDITLFPSIFNFRVNSFTVLVVILTYIVRLHCL